MNNIAEHLKQISADVAALAALLDDAQPQAKAPAYEEVRALLAEKSRTGFRAEVKALLTKHGVAQLSDVREPDKLAAIMAEAEGIGIG